MPLTQGFVENHAYDSKNLQRSVQGMLLWELLGMGPLSQTVLESPVMGAFFSSLPGFLLDWNTAILAPPTDENGKCCYFCVPVAVFLIKVENCSHRRDSESPYFSTLTSGMRFSGH